MLAEPPQVLVLGNAETSEMRPVLASVQRFAAGSHFERAEHVDAAVQMVTDRNWFPHLVIVCQHWPDEFSQADVQRLLGLLPLARLMCCFGAWCESDGRNRDIWPLSVRVPARCAGSRIRRELAVLSREQSALPLTAARDEIFAFDCPGELSGPAAPLPVRVVSPDYELRRWLQELLTTAGFQATGYGLRATGYGRISDFQPCSPKPEARLAAVVWDVDPWRDEIAVEVRQFCARYPQVAVIALMGFAHPEDVEAVEACGADAVVTKLTTQTDLLEALQWAISARKPRPIS